MHVDRSVAWLLVLASLAASSARAQEIPRRPASVRDVWSEPNPGVRYLRRTTSTPTEVHALVVSLRAPGVRLVATRYEERWSTVTDFARSRGLAAAINGGFWSAFQEPLGIAAGGGSRWPSAHVDPEVGFFALDARGRAMVRGPNDAVSEAELATLAEAVSGRPRLVLDGEIDRASLDAFESSNQRQPRTAVGVSRDGAQVMLVVVDGRRASSRGMTLYELARTMIELGACSALNLDGGGSAQMFVERGGGIVNVPSRGRWEAALEDALGAGSERVQRDASGQATRFVRGVEREVLNHLGVVAPSAPGLAPIAHHSALAGVPEREPVRRAAPAPPAVRWGAWRERWPHALALFACGALVALHRARRGVMPRRAARR